MAEQGSYPLNGRALAATDTATGVVTGATADIPLGVLAQFIVGSSVLYGPTASRPSPTTISQGFFDTSLGYMVWCKQVSPAIWVDAAGVSV